jgi:undecaprenyl-diphosphatase
LSVFQAIILGLVQGLTEFLPVSSSGHLVIIPDILGWGEPSTSFDIVLHTGTLVAVLLYFRRDLIEIVLSFFSSGMEAAGGRRLGFLIAIGTVPAVIAGALFEKTFEEFFLNPSAVAGFLLVTGLLLFLTGVMIEVGEDVGGKRRGIDQIRVRDSIYIGLMQATAIAPGISRSGSTIATGLLLGLKRDAAARYSFLLSIPVIAGAAAFRLRHGFGGTGEDTAALLGGFLAAAISGFVAIKFLMSFIQRHSLRVFAYYCMAMGVAVIILHIIR